MSFITADLITSSGVRDIYVAENDRYALIVTLSGLEFVDLYKGAVVSSGILPDSLSPFCVAADWNTSSGLLYVGTSGGGIYSTAYHPARAPYSDFSSSFEQRFHTGSIPPISSNIIKDLDAFPGALFIGTITGVDFISNHSNRSNKFLPGGAEKVHLTANGNTGYWTTVSSVQTNYNLLSTLGGGIIGVDFEYSTVSSPPLPAAGPKDIAISNSSPRALAFPTPSGCFVLEEKPGLESTANFKNFIAPNEFFETPAPQFITSDFSVDASFSGGVLFTATSGTLRAFRLSNDNLVGTHPQAFDDTITDVTRGQTLISGTIGIVRTTTVPV